jgi:hypothetical protein
VRRAAVLGAAVVSTAACGERRDAVAEHRAPPPPADSLATRVGDSVEIWFTLARPDSGPGGPCTERTLEIRRGTTRRPVPLLYTRGRPDVVDDTTLRARLWNDCRPGDAYLVDLRTGRPVRERR